MIINYLLCFYDANILVATTTIFNIIIMDDFLLLLLLYYITDYARANIEKANV